MNDEYLFICCSDLADVDVNGRTVKDTFSYIGQENMRCYCNVRLNQNLSSDDCFCVDDSDIYKFKFFKKMFYKKNCQKLESFKSDIVNKHSKKTPALCLLRYLAWKISYLFWKHRFFKWVAQRKVDYIVYNPGDISFNNFLALKLAKKTNAKLIIYNTEFYYFKTWNYLKKQNAIYPLFIKNFRHSFDKVMKYALLCIYNLPELADLYRKHFPLNKHIYAMHPSLIEQIPENKQPLGKDPLFYYSGSLDKRRHVTLFEFATKLSKIFPNSKILIHGNLGTAITKDDLLGYSNIVYDGLHPYDDVKRILMGNNVVLVSLSPIDSYATKNNYYGFSTKLADCISSLNPFIHIGSVTAETECIAKYHLGYLASSIDEIETILNQLKDDVISKKMPFIENQFSFRNDFLDKEKNEKFIMTSVEDI